MSIDTPKQVLEFHEEFIEKHYSEGEDIQLQMYAMKNNSIFTVPAANRDMMKKVVNLVQDESNIDWACILFTGFMKEATEEEVGEYSDGDLAEDDEAQEIHFIQVYHPEKRIAAYYTKDFEKIKQIDDQEGDIEGELVI